MVCVVADRYIPLSSVLEGFVILKLNPDYQQDHLSSWVGELNSQFCLVFAYRPSLLSSTSNFSNFAVKLPFVLLQSAVVMLRLWNCIAPILPCLLCMEALCLRRRKITTHSWRMIYYMSWQYRLALVKSWESCFQHLSRQQKQSFGKFAVHTQGSLHLWYHLNITLLHTPFSVLRSHINLKEDFAKLWVRKVPLPVIHEIFTFISRNSIWFLLSA